MKNKQNVVHIVVNNLGGITTLVQNLILYKGNIALEQELFLLDVEGNINASANTFLDTSLEPENLIFNPISNWYHSFNKIAKKLSESTGILVSNDQYDLIMLNAFNVPRKVVQLVHDPYNLTLSVKFHEVIDAFVAHSEYIYHELIKMLPDRSLSIYYIPYGIPIFNKLIKSYNVNKPLKLVYLGRHDQQKGIYDLFHINQLLENANIFVEWTMLGRGPETNNFKKQWADKENVKFLTPESAHELAELISENDILVFPSRFEGFPVAVLESMSVGCVPIVSNLYGGIQQVVVDGITGYKCGVGDIKEFSDMIINLHYNREHLFKMQQACINLVEQHYNIVNQAPKYQNLFCSLANDINQPKHFSVNTKIGSRLDNCYIPDWVTKIIRKTSKDIL
jgi:glycosyltransferase involved in cell wall biosynthesis